MNSNKNIVATFQNRFGEERKIHSTRNGLRVMRARDTMCHILCREVSTFAGKKIKEVRKRKGLTMQELGEMASLTTAGNAKTRVWEIENNLRGIGMRFGTLFQIAIALEVEVYELLPTLADLKAITGANLEPFPKLAMSPKAA